MIVIDSYINFELTKSAFDLRNINYNIEDTSKLNDDNNHNLDISDSELYGTNQEGDFKNIEIITKNNFYLIYIVNCESNKFFLYNNNSSENYCLIQRFISSTIIYMRLYLFQYFFQSIRYYLV